MTADDFRDEKQQQIETENLSLQDKITEMDMVQLLQSFWSRNLDKKSRIYYLAQGIDEINEKNPGQLLLVDAIMTVCDALQNFASQLIYVDSSKTNKTNKLNEDYVTMLFREIFNHAFGKSIQLKVFDQEKRGATGTITNGRMSPAELDLLIHYGDESHEVIEAFVLTNQTSNTVFQDHVGKILGNNIKHEPLSFMLIYGNAMDSSKAFDKYRKYLSERALADFSNEGIQQMDLLDVTEAPYYINEFTHAHEGLELIRQRILFDDGRTQEVLHMYLDIAKMQETSIRKSTK